MRQQSNPKRGRGRSNGRKPGGSRNQTFDSNGPSLRVRGNAYQVMEKYLALARDATATGDRIAAENFYQHAEHYFRIMNANKEERAAKEERDNARQQNGRDRDRDTAGGNGKEQPAGNKAKGAAASGSDAGSEAEGQGDAEGEGEAIVEKIGEATVEKVGEAAEKEASEETDPAESGGSRTEH